jgi:outer membrane porin, OprD family
MMLFDFDRAHEDAWLGGVSYRLDDLGLHGWSLVLNHVEGHGAQNPVQHAYLADHRETDLTVDYRPQRGALEGLWLRLRYAHGSEGCRNLHQWRAIFNYEIKGGK